VDRSDLTVLSASPACIGGGAERVAFMLHQEYVARGIDSWLAVANRNCDDPRTVTVRVDEGRSAWASALLKPAMRLSRRGGRAAWLGSRALRVAAEPMRYARVAQGHEDFDFPATGRLLDSVRSAPDVLHLHNLHGAWFDVRALPELSTRVPTMITLHDAWLLTGHCAYPLDCERWKTGCGGCPYLDLYVPIRKDESASNARLKRDAVTNSRLALACPSRWLLDMVEESGIVAGKLQARVVPNGIDTRVFKPGDKAKAREELGIPQDATIMCFAARGLSGSQYKGFQTLSDALGILGRNEDVRATTRLLALGSDAPDASIGGIGVRFVPVIKDPASVARFYQACDLYVHPAKAENFGLAILEAMSCGLPVVAGDVGGVPEIVVEGKTGLLFPHDDPEALAESILSLLTDRELRAAMGAAGVDRIRAEFTLEKQVGAYLDWYRELLDAWQD